MFTVHVEFSVMVHLTVAVRRVTSSCRIHHRGKRTNNHGWHSSENEFRTKKKKLNKGNEIGLELTLFGRPAETFGRFINSNTSSVLKSQTNCNGAKKKKNGCDEERDINLTGFKRRRYDDGRCSDYLNTKT